MASEIVRTPGLRDLMFDNLNHPDPALAEQAASNVFDAVSYGIEAIGDLMFSAAHSENYPPDMETIANIGCLLKTLGELAARLEGYNGMEKFRRELYEVLQEERAAKAKS